ncbi:MAG TPA: YraN family protein, partial [Terriglobus sp.]
MTRSHPLLAILERLTAVSTRVHDRRRGVNAAAQRGHRGEDVAYFFLRRNGFRVVAQRWRSEFAPGEMDVVAWEGETLCFVEVKTRQQRSPLATEAAIDDDKQQAMERLADAYVRALPWKDGVPPQIAIRFDAVLVHLIDERR